MHVCCCCNEMASLSVYSAHVSWLMVAPPMALWVRHCWLMSTAPACLLSTATAHHHQLQQQALVAEEHTVHRQDGRGSATLVSTPQV